MIDQAKAGDPEAAHAVFQTMLEGFTQQIGEVRGEVQEIMDTEAKESAGASNTAL